MSNLSFGTVDAKSDRPFDTTGTLTYSCTGDSSEVIRICPSFGFDDGSDRQMKDRGGHVLLYNLYSDYDKTTIWGTWFGATTGPTIDVPLRRTGVNNGSATIYGQVNPGQGSVAAGSYTSGFGGDRTVISYDYASKGSCQDLKVNHHSSRLPFTVSAQVRNSSGETTAGAAGARTQLQRGMKIEDVRRLLGPGKLLSESSGADGLKTQVFEYLNGEQRSEVTYVDGILVRYSISSK